MRPEVSVTYSYFTYVERALFFVFVLCCLFVFVRTCRFSFDFSFNLTKFQVERKDTHIVQLDGSPSCAQRSVLRDGAHERCGPRWRRSSPCTVLVRPSVLLIYYYFTFLSLHFLLCSLCVVYCFSFTLGDLSFNLLNLMDVIIYFSR